MPALLGLLLSGCASAPAEPARQYLLPGAGQPVAADAALPEVHLQLAGYLDQGGIVLQSGPVTVTTARQHRWADPLPDQLLRALRYHLSRAGLHADGQLAVKVVQFQGGDGHALVAGHWQYQGRNGQHAGGRFQESRPLLQDGYDALVKQLDAAWAAVARDISRQLPPH